MSKNIVICFDAGAERFSISNVRRLFSVLDRNPLVQVSYISSWHRSHASAVRPSSHIERSWTSMKELAFGAGLTTSLYDAYRFLTKQYEPDDKLFLFGFSRGALAAQALAALIHMYGVVTRGDEVLLETTIESFLETRLAMRSNAFSLARNTQLLYSQTCAPHFVGLWETVASTGFVYSPVILPFTSLNPDIAIGRHALAIDERRSMYRPNLWRPVTNAQDIREVWFAGVHSDVGGSYPESQSAAALIAFAWMVGEAQTAGLILDQARLDYVLKDSATKPASYASIPLHRSLVALWWIFELFPTRYVTSSNGKEVRSSIQLPMGRPRTIPEGAAIHESVLERLATVPYYRPANLPTNYTRAATFLTVPAAIPEARIQPAASQPATPQESVRSKPPAAQNNEPIEALLQAKQEAAVPARLRVFLCYVASDEGMAKALAEKIGLAGFEPWTADSLQPGDDMKMVMPDILRAMDLFLVCLSPSFNRKTDKAQKILKYAYDIALEKPGDAKFIIPIKLQECDLPAGLTDYTPVNFYQQSGPSYLLSFLNAYSQRAL